MPNLIGPNQIEFLIRTNTTPIREHVIRFNTVVQGTPANGLPMSAYSLLRKGGGTASADVAINLLWSFLRQFYNTGVTCFGVNLWSVAAGTSERNFMSAMSPTNPNGANAATTIAFYQETLTFRTANGGIQRLVVLEGAVDGGNARSTLLSNAAGTVPQKMASYMMSADNVTIAADDSFVIAPLRDAYGQNEHIWRKANR